MLSPENGASRIKAVFMYAGHNVHQRVNAKGAARVSSPEKPRLSDGSLRRLATRFSSDSLLLAALGPWRRATERATES